MWSDGSVQHEFGAGSAVIYDNNGMEVKIVRTGAGYLASSCAAEMSALTADLESITSNDLLSNNPSRLLICTDSQSSIRKLESGPLEKKMDHTTCRVWKSLLEITKVHQVNIQFVAAHCGVERNEKADKEADEAIKTCDQSDKKIPFERISASIKRRNNQRWAENLKKDTERMKITKKRTSIKERDNMNRRDYCMLSQLRCGENKYIGKFKRRIDNTKEECRWCGDDKESVAHVFEDCPALRMKRNKYGIDIKALDDVNKREAVVQFMTKILPVLP